jgi:hypothetical protein
MSDSLKDFHYFTTSLASVATLFSLWRTAKISYYIHKKKSTVKKIESKEVLSVDELKNRGLKVN